MHGRRHAVLPLHGAGGVRGRRALPGAPALPALRDVHTSAIPGLRKKCADRLTQNWHVAAACCTFRAVQRWNVEG